LLKLAEGLDTRSYLRTNAKMSSWKIGSNFQDHILPVGLASWRKHCQLAKSTA
jgi:hypothetical protein